MSIVRGWFCSASAGLLEKRSRRFLPESTVDGFLKDETTHPLIKKITNVSVHVKECNQASS